MDTIRPTWQEVAAKRSHDINSKIPDEWLLSGNVLKSHKPMDLPRESGILSSRELDITELRAVDILAAIRERRISAVEVTRAFCKRAAIAHQVVSIEHPGDGSRRPRSLAVQKLTCFL